MLAGPPVQLGDATPSRWIGWVLAVSVQPVPKPMPAGAGLPLPPSTASTGTKFPALVAVTSRSQHSGAGPLYANGGCKGTSNTNGSGSCSGAVAGIGRTAKACTGAAAKLLANVGDTVVGVVAA